MKRKLESVQLLDGSDLVLILAERGVPLVEIRQRSIIDAVVKHSTAPPPREKSRWNGNKRMEPAERRNAFRVIAGVLKEDHEHVWALRVRAHITAAVETKDALLGLRDGEDHFQEEI